MGDLTSSPASAVFWGGLLLMLGASWAIRHRPELVARVATYPAGSVGDQAERWLRARSDRP